MTTMTLPDATLKPIPGFQTLKALHHKFWYIIDTISMQQEGGWAGKHAIGGYHLTYTDLRGYADANYTGVYS